MSRVAFVTGASSGLGAGLARRLARSGYAVALAARRLERLDEVARAVRADGGTALPLACDVREPDQVRAAVAAAVGALGPVDLLVANAGVSGMTRPEAFSARTVEDVMRTNFLGPVYAVEAVLPSMLARRSGHLVAVGSLAGYGGLPKSGAYSASKGALHNFFESLRLDLRGSGVDVTVITPGYVKTELTAKNDHRMPFLMELDDAVERIARGIERKEALVAFPLPLFSLVWLAQVLPAAIYDRIGAGVRREKREEKP
ncbi:MAG: SDR family NAD(P)-dependent oxidoreductase [Longimicrobiales bacterium]